MAITDLPIETQLAIRRCQAADIEVIADAIEYDHPDRAESLRARAVAAREEIARLEASILEK